mgnify:CR=1 FL=1
MHDQPLVTVIMPAYNCEQYIGDALRSVLSQSYQNLEIIVIDDGSTDRSAEIVAGLPDDRISLIQQSNAGSAAARNRGLAAATGELLAFIDGDDLWHPRKIELQTQFLSSQAEYGLVYNAWRVIDESTAYPSSALFPPISVTAISVVEEESGWLYETLLTDSCVIHTSATMIRASVAEQIGGFRENLLRGQDYDYWLRICRHTKAAKLSAELSCYRLNTSGVTMSGSSVNYAAIVLNNAIKKYGLLNHEGRPISRKKVNHRLAQIWRNYALQQVSLGAPKLAYHALAKAFGFAPISGANFRALASIVRQSLGLPSL